LHCKTLFGREGINQKWWENHLIEERKNKKSQAFFPKMMEKEEFDVGKNKP